MQLGKEITSILSKEELTNEAFNHGRDILNNKLRKLPQDNALKQKYYDKLFTKLKVKNTKIENEKRIKKQKQNKVIDSKLKELVLHN